MRFPSQAQKKTRKFRFQIEDIGIIFQKNPKRHGNPVLNEVPITSPEKTRKFRFQIKDIGIIFQRFLSQVQKKGNPVFKKKISPSLSPNRRYTLFSRKAQKDTEIPFSNEVPVTSPEKTRTFRFQIEDIGIIFQRFPSQAKKRENPFSNRRYWHYFPEKQKKHGNPVFK